MKSWQGKDSFIFYLEWKSALDKLEDIQLAEVTRGLMSYAETGIRPESKDVTVNLILMIMCERVEKDGRKWAAKCEKNRQSIKGYWDGLKGIDTADTNEYERKGTNTNEYERKGMNLAVYDMTGYEGEVTGLEMTGADVRESESARAHEKTKKSVFGAFQNVFLSDEDITRLRDEVPDIDTLIEKLSAYIASSGKSYQNHYAVLRKWNIEDRAKAGAKEKKPESSKPADVSEWERKAADFYDQTIKVTV